MTLQRLFGALFYFSLGLSVVCLLVAIVHATAFAYVHHGLGWGSIVAALGFLPPAVIFKVLWERS